MKRLLQAFAVVSIATLLPSVVSAEDEPNTLTHGMVQMTLRVGETTQTDVLETFGGPNVTSIDASGQEVWVYDRHATVTSDSTGGFHIGLGIGAGGDGVGGGGLLGFGKKKSNSSSSSRTMMLIIKFDENKVVSDFRSRSSSF